MSSSLRAKPRHLRYPPKKSAYTTTHHRDDQRSKACSVCLHDDEHALVATAARAVDRRRRQLLRPSDPQGGPRPQDRPADVQPSPECAEHGGVHRRVGERLLVTDVLVPPPLIEGLHLRVAGLDEQRDALLSAAGQQFLVDPVR